MKVCYTAGQVKKLENCFSVSTNAVEIRIWFLTDDILRIRAGFDGDWDEASYSLTMTAWDSRTDELMKDCRKRVQTAAAELTDGDKQAVIQGSRLKVVVEKAPFRIMVYDKDGSLLHADIPDLAYREDSNHRRMHASQIEADDCFYGFGEKSGEINKAEKYMNMAPGDAMGYNAKETDSLYKHIPFYIKLNRGTKQAVGYFYHNTAECDFNMGREKRNYWHRYSTYRTDAGDVDLFLVAGPSIRDIIERYTDLTGKSVMLPKAALGYLGSSMYYPELPENSDDAVLGFIDTIKEEGFPIDGFHLSSGYTSQNNKRCVFTWNTERFKDPSAYFHAMNEKHAQNVPNVKPGVLLCNPRFDEFNADDVFVKDSKHPETYGVGKWWGGDGAFWDFTKPEGRTAWKKYLTESIIAVGTDSVWNDNCEYDSLMDKDDICDFDGKGGTIAQLKPIMSTLMCKVGADAVVEHNAKARPYMVCRSGSAGIQRYAQTWCGDNYTSWKSLKYNIPIITGMGLSGQPNEGADIGGFAGPAPTEELFVRWVQQGIFQARFSIHSASNDNTVTEPWMFRGSADLIRDAILLRYRFTPYLYSAEYNASKTGAPIMRALVYDFQDDPNVYEESFEFLFGRDILVANVIEEGAKTRKVYLPAGCKWYDWSDKMRCYEGGQTIEIPVTMASIPMFIREGAVIAMADNQLMTMEGDHTTDLHLIVAPKGTVTTTLYDDDGVTNDFKSGVFRKTTITTTAGERVTMDFTSEGSYEDTVKTVKVEMIAKEKSPFWVTLDGRKIEHFLNRRKFDEAAEGWYYSQTKKAVEVKYANPGKDYNLTVSFEQFDLIGM